MCSGAEQPSLKIDMLQSSAAPKSILPDMTTLIIDRTLRTIGEKMWR